MRRTLCCPRGIVARGRAVRACDEPPRARIQHDNGDSRTRTEVLWTDPRGSGNIVGSIGGTSGNGVPFLQTAGQEAVRTGDRSACEFRDGLQLRRVDVSALHGLATRARSNVEIHTTTTATPLAVGWDVGLGLVAFERFDSSVFKMKPSAIVGTIV